VDFDGIPPGDPDTLATPGGLPDSGPSSGVESVRLAAAARLDSLEGAGEGEGATAEAAALLAGDGLFDWSVAGGVVVPVVCVVPDGEAPDELAAEPVVGGDGLEVGSVAGGEVLVVWPGPGAGLPAATLGGVRLVGVQFPSLSVAVGQRTTDDAAVPAGCIPVSTSRRSCL
jgi:hypothetical protein